MNNTKLITEWIANLEARNYDYIKCGGEIKINRHISKFIHEKISLTEAKKLLLAHQDDYISERVLGDLDIHGINEKKQSYVIELHPVLKRSEDAINKALANSTRPIRIPTYSKKRF